jgi:uncharacterized protein YndB with AHSA1/START domain
MAKIIQHQLFYPHPPRAVWEYLTIPDLMAQWLIPNNFEPVVGHKFQFKTKAKPDADFDGNFYCEVLEVVPFKKLSYSWKFGPGNGILHDSTVSWTLNEKDNGTELLLVHRGFEGSENILLFALMDEGWKKHINTILQLLNAKTDGATQA